MQCEQYDDSFMLRIIESSNFVHTAKACELCTYAAAHKRPQKHTIHANPSRKIWLDAPSDVFLWVCPKCNTHKALTACLPTMPKRKAICTEFSQWFQRLLLPASTSQDDNKKGKPDNITHLRLSGDLHNKGKRCSIWLDKQQHNFVCHTWPHTHSIE